VLSSSASLVSPKGAELPYYGATSREPLVPPHSLIALHNYSTGPVKGVERYLTQYTRNGSGEGTYVLGELNLNARRVGKVMLKELPADEWHRGQMRFAPDLLVKCWVFTFTGMNADVYFLALDLHRDPLPTSHPP
jgi:hypothetical protein